MALTEEQKCNLENKISNKTDKVLCPFCQMEISSKALICPYCRNDLKFTKINICPKCKEKSAVYREVIEKKRRSGLCVVMILSFIVAVFLWFIMSFGLAIFFGCLGVVLAILYGMIYKEEKVVYLHCNSCGYNFFDETSHILNKKE